jgi:hypothetical protein
LQIIFNETETLPEKIPNGTTLVKWNKSGDKVLYCYEIQNSQLVITEDYVEQQRDWRPGEKEEYLKNNPLSKKSILEFQIKDPDKQLHRLHELYDDVALDYFKFTKSFGMEEYKGEYRGTFEIKVMKDSIISEVVNELEFVVTFLKENGQTEPRLNISEHSLSANGIYYINFGQQINISQTRYGTDRCIKEFDDLESCCREIQKKYYY